MLPTITLAASLVLPLRKGSRWKPHEYRCSGVSTRDMPKAVLQYTLEGWQASRTCR